ncbi:MAG: MFS transporter [Arachnia sp.]
MASPHPDSSPDPDGSTGTPSESGDERWASPGVIAVAVASLGSDTGHEITTSLLPTFLTSVLHAGPAALGAIEGVSDALVGLSKLVGGPLSTDPARRGRIASGGYLLTAVATGAIALTTALWQVALLRAIAWSSRGLRSPARDALLMSLVPRKAYGRASGLERAGDNAGALLGPLLAAALVASFGLRNVMLIAAVPGLLAVVAITVAARETRRTVRGRGGRQALSFNLAALREAGLYKTLAVITPFEMGNVATTLLILRTTDLLSHNALSLAEATSIAILLYACHNAAAMVAALVAGRVIDRSHPRGVFAAASVIYVLAYLTFAWEQHSWLPLLVAFVLAGIGIGLAEPAETTMVALALPDNLRGNGFGLLGLVQSFGDLGASLVAGLIWAVVSPTAAFIYVAAWMVIASVATIWRGRSA